MSAEDLHEPIERLSDEVIDRHRAIRSIVEEFEAIDWYDQRACATGDAELAALLAHNRDEEKEHAAMAIEWLRRRDPVFAEQLRNYLFTDEQITEIESEAESESGGHAAPEPDGLDTEAVTTTGPAATHDLTHHSLGIGSLKAITHWEDQP